MKKGSVLKMLSVLICIIALVGARAALAETERTQSDPTAYWWYYGVTGPQLSQYLSQNNARIVDLQVESVSSSGPVFTASMVSNTGPYAEAWWWYYGLTGAEVSQILTDLNARLISIAPYQNGGSLQFAAVMVSNTGANAKQAWWWYGSGGYIGSQLAGTDGRIVDLENYDVGGSEGYAAIAIANTGADAAPWWWWFGVTPNQIGTDLATNPAQLLTLAPDGNNFDAIMQGNPPAEWWYYYGLSQTLLTDYLNQDGARPVEVRSNFSSGSRAFDAILINNSNACTTRLGNIEREFSGWAGAYVKQVGGPVLCNLNDARQFEPASAIKIVVATYAMLQVQDGLATLNQSVPLLSASAYCNNTQVSLGSGTGTQNTFAGTLPTSNGPLYPNSLFVVAGAVTATDNGTGLLTGSGVSGTINYTTGAVTLTYTSAPAAGTQILVFEKYSAAVKGMMQNSDNARTDMFMHRFGLATLTSFAHSVGMPNTQLNQYVDCGAPGGPNYMTLDDGTHLYETLAQGTLLTPANVQTLFQLMAGKNYDFSGIWNNLETIIAEVAPANLSAPQIAAFENGIQLSQKSGGYSWPGGNTAVDGFDVFASVGNVGWVQIPSCNGAAQTSTQYVYGFLAESTNATQADNTYDVMWEAMAAGAELLREEVQTALSTWSQCSP
jgi:hypothetical protein